MVLYLSKCNAKCLRDNYSIPFTVSHIQVQTLLSLTSLVLCFVHLLGDLFYFLVYFILVFYYISFDFCFVLFAGTINGFEI